MRILLVVSVSCAALGALWYLHPSEYLSVESLKSHHNAFLAYTKTNYVTAVVLFMTLYCLKTALSLPGSAVFTMVGGVLFGWVLGTLYVIVAATVGATLAFLCARHFLRDWVEQKFGARFGSMRDCLGQHGFCHVLTLRLIPAVPFFLVNLASGVTNMSLRTYIAATALGIIPGTFVLVYAGEQLGIR